MAKSTIGDPRPSLLAHNAHGSYCVPVSSQHRPAAQAILSRNIWEPETIDYLTSHCCNGDVVHAGAYFGDFLPALSRSVSPNATLWAFEPVPENYQCALETIRLNGLANVQLVNAALGERRGSSPMMIADAAGIPLGGASRIVANDDARKGQQRFIVVDVVSLDEIVPPDRDVSIIQLDVEGFEKPALSGALMTIRRCRPILVLESLPEPSWLSANLHHLGYRVAGHVHGNAILRCD